MIKDEIIKDSFLQWIAKDEFFHWLYQAMYWLDCFCFVEHHEYADKFNQAYQNIK